MITDFSSVTWQEAVRGFILHKKAVRAPGTALFYQNYCNSLANWAVQEKIPFDVFTKRRLDEYLVYRAEAGRTPSTLQKDALCATVFFEWCKRNDLIERDPLAEYKVRTAPKPHMYMPTKDDVQRLLQAVIEFYDPSRNPDARFSPPPKRGFHRDRCYAIELVKLDSACRIGEILSFKTTDYQERDGGRQLTVRESKGREPRTLPVSKECAVAIELWLKIRKRVMVNVIPEEDEGWLFVSETGGRIDEGNYLRGIKKIAAYAGLSKAINNHSQRRFSLNGMAENGDILFAQRMAGHKDPKTTMTYLAISSGYLREKHDHVGTVRNVLVSARSVKRKRLI